ncbi:MAG: hypothetical protein OXL96_00285 [Candidatus Poribacteria bacterium]|nr:hypothetical protein [Candidatus Dadabacteria bacterium]MDE0396219.1 hypothetical protein [Candidatus Poribacteria bacterium]
MASLKVKEDRLRRTARRRGKILLKTRRRDPGAFDYGLYAVLDSHTRTPVPWLYRDSVYVFTLDQAEAVIMGKRFVWQIIEKKMILDETKTYTEVHYTPWGGGKWINLYVPPNSKFLFGWEALKALRRGDTLKGERHGDTVEGLFAVDFPGVISLDKAEKIASEDESPLYCYVQNPTSVDAAMG